MSEYIEPLNLQYIFTNTLAGTPSVFLAIFLVVISILAGYFKMSRLTYGMMLLLSSIFLYSWLGSGWFLIFIIIASLIAFVVLRKLVSD
ncbi:MAG: hypothetical protein ACTSXD_14495 [Candidatus Heimdallarchaeaceae archaeon]